MGSGCAETTVRKNTLKKKGKWERAAAMSLLEEMKAFTRVVEQKPTLLLGESAFKLWHERELGMSESEAQQKWDTDSATKSSVFKRKEDGVLKVAVKGHTTIMMETGMESSKKLQQVPRQDDFQGPLDFLRTDPGESKALASAIPSMARIYDGDESNGSEESKERRRGRQSSRRRQRKRARVSDSRSSSSLAMSEKAQK